MADKMLVIVLLISGLNLVLSQDLTVDPSYPIDPVRPIPQCRIKCAAVMCAAVYCKYSLPPNPFKCQCCPTCPIYDPPIIECAVDCRTVLCAQPKCAYGMIPADPTQCRCCPSCVESPTFTTPPIIDQPFPYDPVPLEAA